MLAHSLCKARTAQPTAAGLMGRATAEALHKLGYQVSAWSRTQKQHEVRRAPARMPGCGGCQWEGLPTCGVMPVPGRCVNARAKLLNVTGTRPAALLGAHMQACASPAWSAPILLCTPLLLPLAAIAQAIMCHHGMEGLREFVSRLGVLVCLLPLTASTQGAALIPYQRSCARASFPHLLTPHRGRRVYS